MTDGTRGKTECVQFEPRDSALRARFLLTRNLGTAASPPHLGNRVVLASNDVIALGEGKNVKILPRFTLRTKLLAACASCNNSYYSLMSLITLSMMDHVKAFVRPLERPSAIGMHTNAVGLES